MPAIEAMRSGTHKHKPHFNLRITHGHTYASYSNKPAEITCYRQTKDSMSTN